MTTPEPGTEKPAPVKQTTSWRDIVQTGADFDQIEGFALEHLIDFQRDRARIFEEDR